MSTSAKRCTEESEFSSTHKNDITLLDFPENTKHAHHSAVIVSFYEEKALMGRCMKVVFHEEMWVKHMLCHTIPSNETVKELIFSQKRTCV